MSPVPEFTPTPTIAPAEETVKFVKPMRLVPAVVPERMVSQPVPTLIAEEVKAPAPDSVRVPTFSPLMVSVPAALVAV